MSPSRRVLVVTVVHTPLDARIHYRQVRALLDAGWEVVQAAPWSAYGVDPPDLPRFRAVDVRRAEGRDRAGAVLSARRVIRRLAPRCDLVLLHDPDLLPAVAGIRGLPPTVWDVHEDTAAALTDRAWVPPAAAPALRRLVAAAERWAEAHLHLLLAEEAYRGRFARPHPVVANHPVVPDTVPPPGDDRLVYVGRVSRGRGAEAMVEVARLLAGEVEVELVGPADADVRPALERAAAEGRVTWRGFLPNDAALARVEGALAGLSLLRDEPNYRDSLPTKVVEYLARGVPAITTPLPVATRIVEGGACGVVVPFDDPDAVAAAARRLRADPAARRDMAARGRAAVRARHSWEADAPRFVAQLEQWAAAGGPR